MTFLFCILILLIIFSAFFSSAETGMMAANRYRLQFLAKSGKRSAKLVLKLLDRTDRLLSVILIGNTFANVLASALATLIAIQYFGEAGALVATIILTLVILIFAEIAPKTVASSFADKYACLIAPILQLLLYVLHPIVWLVNNIAKLFLKILCLDVKHRSVQPLSHDELRSIVHSSSEDIAAKDKDMLLSVFDLKKVDAIDVMVPRSEIIGIDLTDPIEDIIKQIQSAPYSRLPLFYNSIENLCGILHLRKAISLFSDPHLTPYQLKSAALKPYFITENVPLTKQLLRFQQNKERMAFVVDEYGEIQGLITIDDILKEIVGEFTTEETDVNRDIQAQGDGSYFVDGSITIRELNREIDINLPTDGPKTLNGLIIEHLETIPKAGTSVKLNGHPVEIIHIKHNQIKTVRIKL